uniref:RING-type E3 ubiquitin transferase n=1 Tax=Populus alba TaxID=43335 RepID=A0A4U5PWA6_POPAL|nr:hypothetical protein D5086_0000169100 [Populus alba]
MKRASATNRDFHTVLAEVELRVRVQLAGILAKTIDPVLAGLKNLVIDGGGVCQEELEIGEEARVKECMHKFHCSCIYKCSRKKKTCPLCRYQMEI